MISAVVMPEPGAPLEVRSFARPELEPGAILLRTLGSEVCGTDAHLWKGQLAGVPYPLVPGHVSVGRLQKIRGALFDVEGKLSVKVTALPFSTFIALAMPAGIVS